VGFAQFAEGKPPRLLPCLDAKILRFSAAVLDEY